VDRRIVTTNATNTINRVGYVSVINFYSGVLLILSSRMSLVAPMRAQMVQGGNLQTMIADVARRYGAYTYQQAPGLGACRCAGGTGHCVGCKPTPIHNTFQRAAADNGQNGRDGEFLTAPLLPGSRGMDGSVTIAVRRNNGAYEEYRSCYRIELVHFDVEDENGDGIFEPGEHLFIRRMRIRNSGMSPSITLQPRVNAMKAGCPPHHAESQSPSEVRHGSFPSKVTMVQCVSLLLFLLGSRWLWILRSKFSSTMMLNYRLQVHRSLNRAVYR
jgi:hypothetical protein